MNKIIKELGKKALSNYDIDELLQGKTKILTYPELGKYKNIDEVFGKYDSVILLYLTKQNFGHWVSLIRYKDRIEFFDSYNFFPDEELKFSKKHNIKIKGQNFPLLTYFFLKAMEKGYKIEYNNTRLQKMVSDVSTCGRHAVMRIVFKNLPLDRYIKLIKSSKYDPDDMVTILTALI